jgi:hypothetical protein
MNTYTWFVCLLHNIQGNHLTHIVLAGLWPFPLMPTKYMLSMNNSHPNQNLSPTHILTSCMAEFKHLDETRQEVVNQIGTGNGTQHYGFNKTTKLRFSIWGTQFLGFQRAKRNTLESSKNGGLVHIKYNIVSLTILYYSSTSTNSNEIPI